MGLKLMGVNSYGKNAGGTALKRGGVIKGRAYDVSLKHIVQWCRILIFQVIGDSGLVEVGGARLPARNTRKPPPRHEYRH